jgi:DNA-nicking Smr family endonuclease
MSDENPRPETNQNAELQSAQPAPSSPELGAAPAETAITPEPILEPTIQQPEQAPTSSWTEAQRNQHIQQQARIKEQRLSEILARIRERGSIKVKDVVDMFHVTAQTARSYLRKLKYKAPK